MEKLSEKCTNEEHVKYMIYCDKLIAENDQLRRERDCLRDQYKKVSTQMELNKRKGTSNDVPDGNKTYKTTQVFAPLPPKNFNEVLMKQRYNQLETDYKRILSEHKQTTDNLAKSGEIVDDLRKQLRREMAKSEKQSTADDDVAENLKIMQQYIKSIKEISNKHAEAMQQIKQLEAVNKDLNESLFHISERVRDVETERDNIIKELQTSQEKTTNWETSYLQLQTKYLKLNNSPGAAAPPSEVDVAKVPLDKKLIRQKYDEAFTNNYKVDSKGATYNQIVDKIKEDYNHLTSMLKEQSILETPKLPTSPTRAFPLTVEVEGGESEESHVETALREISQINRHTTALANRIDVFKGGKEDVGYAEMMQALLENLLKIDMVEVNGFEIVKIRREHATKYVKDCLRRLETKVNRRWESVRPFRH